MYQVILVVSFIDNICNNMDYCHIDFIIVSCRTVTKPLPIFNFVANDKKTFYYQDRRNKICFQSSK